MLTIKLVVIGASGVGKTSLRGQYISGRFSTGYRATIGADFITKTLPHPDNSDESVMLQIWDTAGQERFSSLSTAFFRGADAALLMFDVNEPETMETLTKWWAEFRVSAPLADENMEDYCCVVVGNKTDMVGTRGGGAEPVTEARALHFLDQLVPPSSRPPSPIQVLPYDGLQSDTDEDEDDPLASSQLTERPHPYTETQPFRPLSPPSFSPPSPPPSPPRTRSNTIAIAPASNHSHFHTPSNSPKHRLAKTSSRSSSRFYGGTMTTTHTTLTIYHTPSSSLHDVYESARSSPEPWSASASPSVSSSYGAQPRRMTSLSNASTSSGSAPTITPSLFAREQSTTLDTASTTPENDPFTSFPPRPPRGPKLFFTSAKTGAGVSDVFEYIAQRVVRRWKYEEELEARRMHIREASGADTIRLGLENGKGRWGDGKGGWECCGS